ncbi:CBS domain-containing protein [Sediminicurvatus halobius]|nr:CBS domain-containing protein [Spiribacter halobius]UEX78686.1 CBS domain-containing protein [Spiribacter halobius]
MTRRPVALAPDDTVETAYRLFEREHFHHLPVVDGQRLVGVVSDRDVLRAVSPFLETGSERDRDRYTLRRALHMVMTRKVITASPQDTLAAAADRMIVARVGCLPVCEAERLVGIVTRSDLLKVLVAGR